MNGVYILQDTLAFEDPRNLPYWGGSILAFFMWSTAQPFDKVCTMLVLERMRRILPRLH